MERSVQAQLVRLEVPEDRRETGEETAVLLRGLSARRQTRRDSGDHVLPLASGPGVPFRGNTTHKETPMRFGCHGIDELATPKGTFAQRHIWQACTTSFASKKILEAVR